MTGGSLPAADGSGTQGTAMQLHTLRHLDAPLEDQIRLVAAAGYGGVEFADRLFDTAAAPIRTALAETGTTPVAAHVDLARLEADPAGVVEHCRAVGCGCLVVPHVGPGHFRTTACVDALAARLTALHDRLALDDVALQYHTQLATLSPRLDQFGLGWATRVPIPGGWGNVAAGLGRAARFDGSDIADRTAFGRLLERTPAELSMEVDVGWVAAAGYDPLDVFDLLGPRLGTVHVADVRVTRRFPRSYGSAAPGTGLVDMTRVIPAARASDAAWLVYEDDDPADVDGAIAHGAGLLGLGTSAGTDGPGGGPEESDRGGESWRSVVQP